MSKLAEAGLQTGYSRQEITVEAVCLAGSYKGVYFTGQGRVVPLKHVFDRLFLFCIVYRLCTFLFSKYTIGYISGLTGNLLGLKSAREEKQHER